MAKISASIEVSAKHVHDGNRDAAVSLLRNLVPEYQPNVDSNAGASAA